MAPLDSHAAALLHEAPTAFSLRAPLNLYWGTSISSQSWLRDILCVFFDIVEHNPLVRSSQEVLPRNSGRRLMTRNSCSLSCDFPGPSSFSLCFAARETCQLFSSQWDYRSWLPMWRFPTVEVSDHFFVSCHREMRCHSQPITYHSYSVAEKPLSKGNTKAWERRLFVYGEGEAYDMWICQMLPLWILLKYALYWPQLLYLCMEGVRR